MTLAPNIAKIFAQAESRYHDVIERLARMSIHTNAYSYVIEDPAVRNVFLIFSVYPAHNIVYASIVYPATQWNNDGDFESIEDPLKAVRDHVAPGGWGSHEELDMKQYLLTLHNP